MTDVNGLCPTCGQRSQSSTDDTEIPTYRVGKEEKPNNWAEDNLMLHNELLEQINLQLNQLHTDVKQANGSEELLMDLKNMMIKFLVSPDSGIFQAGDMSIYDTGSGLHLPNGFYARFSASS